MPPGIRADPAEVTEPTLSMDDATDPRASRLLLAAVRKDSGLAGPVTACAAAVATAAAPSSECLHACKQTRSEYARHTQIMQHVQFRDLAYMTDRLIRPRASSRGNVSQSIKSIVHWGE